MNRSIQDLIDLRTGQPLKADDVLSQSEAEIHTLRRELREIRLRFKKGDTSCATIACELCHQPVVIVGDKNRNYHFKHGYESGDCPIKTTSKYTHDEICRMKYNGAKESRRHFDLKSAIVHALKGPKSSCTDVAPEKRIRSSGLSKEWRQPDVQAVCGDKRLAFEIQLSTTFLDVIIGREQFYQSEHVFMLWVFSSFSEGGLRFTEKDTYYANNRNAYVITDETRKRSEELGELVLLCHYQEPFIAGQRIVDRWVAQEVTLGDLTFDEKQYRAYYFNFDAEKKKLEEELAAKPLTNQFAKYWESRPLLDEAECSEEDKNWFFLLKTKGLIPDNRLEHISFPEDLRQILDALYCLKTGRIFAYRYDNWIQVANLVLETRREFSGLFLHALKEYGLLDKVIRSDKKGTFRKKRGRANNGVKERDPKFEQNLEYRPLFQVLFPELMKK